MRLHLLLIKNLTGAMLGTERERDISIMFLFAVLYHLYSVAVAVINL